MLKHFPSLTPLPKAAPEAPASAAGPGPGPGPCCSTLAEKPEPRPHKPQRVSSVRALGTLVFFPHLVSPAELHTVLWQASGTPGTVPVQETVNRLALQTEANCVLFCRGYLPPPTYLRLLPCSLLCLKPNVCLVSESESAS